MIIPTINPTTTANEIFTQFCKFSIQRIRKVATTIKAELKFVPTASEPNNSFMPAFSFVLTEKIPIMERRMPTAAINIGAITALNCMVVSFVPI